MRITEVSGAVMKALRDRRFVGDFIVTIYHPNMAEVKVNGNKSNEFTVPFDFSYDLGKAINELCFLIVSGVISDDEDFTFDIRGQIAYLYAVRRAE